MDYTPLNNHMSVKNHMAMWFLWFLRIGFLKLALQAVLRVFARVVLVWFLCGRICGFWFRVVFALLFARPIGLLWSLWSCPRRVPADLCGLLKRFARRPASCYVPSRRHSGDLYRMEKTIMARTSVKVRLRNVRIAYPRLFTPDEKTRKRSCLIMIPNDSEAAQAWRRGVAETWRVAQDELSKASFPDNPSPALTRAMLGIKVAGEISPSGSVYPEEYAGHIVFTASSKRDISVCNNRGNALNATDKDVIYSGQIAHVAIELFPFKIPEKTGISRILQNVFIVGGGERIALDSGSHNLSAAEEWADEISESASSSSDDDAESFPF